YKTLHSSAMGAAIPLLLQLTCALSPTLPFSQDGIHTEVLTGTCEVQDEVILDDDDDTDITIKSRFKFDGCTTGPARKTPKVRPSRQNKFNSSQGSEGKGKEKASWSAAPQGVFFEPEQEDEDEEM
ncbi:hypothetical protein FA13DRAFT_1628674, partial [Coprinellus micaceus]